MNHTKYFIAIITILSLLVFSSCGHKHTEGDGHNHGAEESTHSEDDEHDHGEKNNTKKDYTFQKHKPRQSV